MPLSVPVLKAAILQGIQDAENNALGDIDPKDALAQSIAEAIVDEVRKITIVATDSMAGPVTIVSVT